MTPQFIKTALRNFRKYPGYAFLNLTGLAVGLAASFVLILYAYRELTYDRQFAGGDRVYRIATDFYRMGGFAKSQEQLLDFLPQECPDIEIATRFDRGFRETPVEVGNTVYQEPHYLLIDTNFFELFPHRFLAGSPAGVMRSPDEVVLSRRLARKYFGEERPLGKTVKIGKEKKPYTVSAVVEEMDKTHLRAGLWLPLELPEEGNQHWTNVTYYNYVRLKEAGSRENLKRSLDALLRNHAWPASQSETTFEQWVASNQAVQFFVQPLKDIYLHSGYKFEVSPGGNPTQVYALGLIGLFIILIAGVNYINLTTARTSIRAKEVGVKKTLGAPRRALVRQFMGESVVNSLLALVLAFFLARFAASVFGGASWAPLLKDAFSEGYYLGALVFFAVLVGLLSGIYPAFYLTRFRPANILKGEMAPGGNKALRGGLVVGQFTIAIGLITASMIVFQQLKYMQEKDKGFEMEGVLVVENADKLGNQAEAFRQELAQQSQVESMAFSGRIPTDGSVWMYTYQTPEMAEALTIQTFPVDADVIPTLGMRLLEGRNFSKDIASDSTAAILNEAAVRALGLENPIGAEINEGQRVIGVVHDFNFQSLKHQIEPVVMAYTPAGSRLALRLQGRDMSGFLAVMEDTWRRFSADEPIRYFFLDDNFAELAANERTLSRAVAAFTLIALLIACLGLFGLAAFTAEQRTKEIGIRKILGASVASLVGLLSRDFLKLVALALAIALPLAWYAMHRWLQNFAYRIDIAWWVLPLAALLALLVAFLTVSVQSLRVATGNPAEALRSE
ncbi:MAG: ABC transporter permease [Lewinellaceae bacterium]|nr:ABC transporter permease [Lewinellaceae bacterium]